MSIYGITDTGNFINEMSENGYECIQTDEGVLGNGDWILLSNDETKYNFEIREKFLNEWSSGQTIRRFSKLSKRLQKEINSI